MRGFSGRFKQFYVKKGRELLRFPSSIALFKREVNLLFNEFKKHLIENFQSSKGLTLKDFERILEDEGFMIIKDKK